MKTVPLGKLTTLISSGSTPLGGSKIYLSNGPVMLIRSQNVLMQSLDLEGIAFITKEIAEKMKRTVVITGDVLLNITGASIGRVATFELEGIQANVNQHVCIIRPISELLYHRYLMHFISQPNFQTYIDSTQDGGTRQALTFEKISNFQVPLPPIAEQRRIAAILDKAEELRELRRQALRELDAIAQFIFIEMFGASIEASKNSVTSSLGPHLQFLTSGGRGWAKFYSTTGSRFIRSLDVQVNYISNEDRVYVTPPDNAEAKRTRISKGDVLLTITGSQIGRIAPVLEDLDGAFISQHVAIIRPKLKTINPFFLSFFLNLKTGGQRQIAKMQYGQTKPGLNFEQIKSFQIPIPPISLQEEFVHRIEAIEQLKTTHRESLTQFDALFASLQHRAFRGEL